MTTRSLRCSSLPLIGKCPASMAVDVDEPVITGQSDSARLGTGVHAVLAGWILCGRSDTEAEAAQTYGVDVDELRRLASWGWSAWLQVRDWFPDPATEVELESKIKVGSEVFTITGHADILAVADDEVRVGDFKSGWLDLDHDDQLRGYAWLALERYPQCKRAYVSVLRVREGTIDGRYYTAEELDAWVQQFLTNAQRQGEYRPGRHCGYCPRGAGCSAKTALLRQSMQALCVREHDVGGLGAYWPTGENAGRVLMQMHEHAKHVQSLAEITLDAIRAEVMRLGGRVPDGNGHELVITEQEQRKIIAPMAWDTLTATLPLAQLLGCVTVSKSSVEKAVMATAPRGQKGKVAQALLETLEVEGAIERKIVSRLEVKRSKESISGNSDPTTLCAVTGPDPRD